MNNVSVRVMNPEEILEKTEELLKLSVKLEKSLSENGVVVSVFEDNFGEVQVCNVCVDFSEHDKKVTEEKDKKIAELEKENAELDRMRKSWMETAEKWSKLNKDLQDRIDSFEFAINQTAELQDRHQTDCIEINRLNVALEIMMEKYMKLREVHGL